MRSVCVLSGDGIGPEVVDCALKVLAAVTDDVEIVNAEIGEQAYRRTGSYLPDDTLNAMMDADTCFFGAITSRRDPDYDSPVLRASGGQDSGFLRGGSDRGAGAGVAG